MGTVTGQGPEVSYTSAALRSSTAGSWTCKHCVPSKEAEDAPRPRICHVSAPDGLSYFQDERACIRRGWRRLRGAVRPLQPVGSVERSQSPRSCASGGPLAPSRGLGVWSRKACRAGSRVAQALSPIIPPPQQPSRQAQSKQRLREAQPPTQGHTAICSQGRI